MTQLLNIIKSSEPYIIIALTIVSLLLIILVCALFNSISNLQKRYRKLMRGASNKNIEEAIVSYMDKIDEVKEDSETIKQLYNDIDNRIKNCVQKMAIVRYKAFEDVGSDLSYSVALLDAKNNGVIFTSIYGRNESTTYAKPIDKGISRYDLSEEEKQALNDAINK